MKWLEDRRLRLLEKRALRRLREYWLTPVDSLKSKPEQRVAVYLAYTLLVGVLTFGAFGVRQLQNGIAVTPQFLGMYAWHGALNFGMCFIAFDFALALGCHLRRRSQNVELTWLIGFSSFLLGFVLQRTLVYHAIADYYPKLLQFYSKYPAMRPSAVKMFFFCLPFWLIAFSMAIWLLLRLQRSSVPAGAPPLLEAPPAVIDAPECLQVTTDRGIIFLPLQAITHISMDDHYAAIFVQEEEGMRSEYVRMTLQQAMARLPSERFVQIHRSHLINLHHLVELRKNGRSREAVVGRERHTLPVSRNRLWGVCSHLPDDRGEKRPGSALR